MKKGDLVQVIKGRKAGTVGYVDSINRLYGTCMVTGQTIESKPIRVCISINNVSILPNKGV